jgi:hypothetical protein
MAEDDSTLEDSSVLTGSGQPSFLEGVTNALGLIGGLATIGASISQLTEIFNEPSAPADFIIPDLANNGSQSLGFLGASGGIFSTSQIVNVVEPRVDEELTQPRGSWQALDFMINKALNSMDWQTKNTDPGNENILEAYRLAGRGFTRDGGTGQFSWSAAFATWILTKSGFAGLRTMSPLAFQRYANTVRFHAGPLSAVRKWDIFIFTSNLNIHHVGFVKGFDPRTGLLEIVGGDQADRVKVTEMPYSVSDQRFRVTHVRRNWIVPTEIDIPLWELSESRVRARPTRPGQGTSGLLSPTSTNPTFNEDGTVAGAGQAARPGARPVPTSRAAEIDRNAGGAAAAGGTLT